jgi:hypothetical protein
MTASTSSESAVAIVTLKAYLGISTLGHASFSGLSGERQFSRYGDHEDSLSKPYADVSH